MSQSRKCPHCGAPCEADVAYCLKCGKALEGQSSQRPSAVAWPTLPPPKTSAPHPIGAPGTPPSEGVRLVKRTRKVVRLKAGTEVPGAPAAGTPLPVSAAPPPAEAPAVVGDSPDLPDAPGPATPLAPGTPEAPPAAAAGKPGATQPPVQAPPPPPRRYATATLARRLPAFAIDTGIVMVVWFVVHMVREADLGLATGALNTLIACGYFGLLSMGEGRTPGKRVLKLRVVRQDDAESEGTEGLLHGAAEGLCLGMCLLWPVLVLSAVFAATRPDRLTVHDIVTKTKVIDERQPLD